MASAKAVLVIAIALSISAVGRIDVDHLHLPLEALFFGEACHYQKAVAEDEAVAPMLIVTATIGYRLTLRITTPAPTSPMPNHPPNEGRSWRKTAAKIATKITLNLSTGATLEASPTFSARK